MCSGETCVSRRRSQGTRVARHLRVGVVDKVSRRTVYLDSSSTRDTAPSGRGEGRQGEMLLSAGQINPPPEVVLIEKQPRRWANRKDPIWDPRADGTNQAPELSGAGGGRVWGVGVGGEMCERPRLCSSLQVDSLTQKPEPTRAAETRAAPAAPACTTPGVALAMASPIGLGLAGLRPPSPTAEPSMVSPSHLRVD